MQSHEIWVVGGTGKERLSKLYTLIILRFRVPSKQDEQELLLIRADLPFPITTAAWESEEALFLGLLLPGAKCRRACSFLDSARQ